MKINVVNKYKHVPQPNDVYVGRGSPLGNPFHISGSQSRDEVCDKYEEHLKTLNQGMCAQLNNIVKVGTLFGEVNLVCFCKPQRCHGDSIKKLIEKKLCQNVEK